jgi:alkanesulfonate monooxygenase SsuD/methylene tetrahydromethanopterin reductase-like flavin-dependent oxidoreductase (luciferase family)
MPDTNPTPVDSALTQQIASILDKPSVYMGGPSRRSLRLAGEIVELLRSARAAIPGPDSERIRELEAENERLRQERDRARAMVPLPPPDPRTGVRVCCGDTHPHGGPECSDG